MKTAVRPSTAGVEKKVRPLRVKPSATPEPAVNIAGRHAHPGNDAGVLGTAVHTLRTARRLTLAELSALSGISQSALSKIENGRLSPTYEKIVALANGLSIEVSELFSPVAGPTPTGRRGITRKGQGVHHVSPQYAYELLCADVSGKQFVPLVTTIKAKSPADFAALPSHGGEEFFFVLEGTVTLHSSYYEPVTFGQGDSCYFDSHMGHALVAGGKGDAKVLWVCSRNVSP